MQRGMRGRGRRPAGRPRQAGRPVLLTVSLAPIVGGAERSLLLLAEYLPAAGWSVVLACPPGPLADEADRRGVPVRRLPLRKKGPVSRRVGGRKRYSVRAVAELAGALVTNTWHLARAVRSLRPDVVHSNSMPSHLPVCLGARLGGRPAVLHLREIITPGPGRLVLDGVGRLAVAMVAISRAVAASVRHPRVPVVLNPVAPPPVGGSRLDWGVPGPVVGYLGRLDPGKGLEDLVDAAALVDASVVVVGQPYGAPPGYVDGLRGRAERVAPGRVHFVGPTPDPWPALASFDVLVVPSVEEPFGRVAAEAQRAGVAVLAADAAGLLDVVTDGVDGLLFSTGDPGSLAARLRELLDDPGLRGRLAQEGRRRSGRFDPGEHAAAMVRLLETVAVTQRARLAS